MASTSKSVFITSCPTRCFNTATPALSKYTVDNNGTSAQCDVLKLEQVIRPNFSICGYHIDSAVVPRRYTEDPYSSEPNDTVYVIWTRHDENHDSQPSENLTAKQDAAAIRSSQNASLVHMKMKKERVMSTEISDIFGDLFHGQKLDIRKFGYRRETKMQRYSLVSNIGEDYIDGIENKDENTHKGMKKTIKKENINEEKPGNDGQQNDHRGQYQSVYENNFISEDTTPVDEYMAFIDGSNRRRNGRRKVKIFNIREKTRKCWTRFSQKCHRIISSVTMFQGVLRNRRDNSEENIGVSGTHRPSDTPRPPSLQRSTLNGKAGKHDCFV